MHHVNISLRRLSEEHFILIRNSWSHIIDSAQDLLAVSNELSFIIEVAVIEEIGFIVLSGAGIWEVDVVELVDWVLEKLRVIGKLVVLQPIH